MIILGQAFPNFQANTSDGPIDFYEWLGDSWGILFSHPSDFTPVCTTELSRLCRLVSEFKKREVKIIALSCNSVETHMDWIEDIKSYSKNLDAGFPYMIIADEDREISTKLGMLDPVEKDADGIPLSCRAVFVIDPKKSVRLTILYPATTGRNFEEILRVVDSMQLADKYRVATPVDWKQGDRCMIQPSVTNKEAAEEFPKGFTVVEVPSQKQYMRVTLQPPH